LRKSAREPVTSALVNVYEHVHVDVNVNVDV